MIQLKMHFTFELHYSVYYNKKYHKAHNNDRNLFDTKKVVDILSVQK